jgi:DNA polymerase
MAHTHAHDPVELIAQSPTLPLLQLAVQQCRGCSLYEHGTQAVFGEGLPGARILLVGEQPGNEEDLQGRPFVGPAGRLLDRALQDARIDRASTYVTNAVKHFKFEERGKRRLHKKPGAAEVRACYPWLEAEVRHIRPQAIVCLGATAALAVMGKDYRLTRERGKVIPHAWAPLATSTVHPSAILRIRESEDRHRAYDALVADLRKVREALQPEPSASASRGSLR